MRSWIAACVLGLSACASAPESVVLDAEAHGRLTVEGFREASPFVASRLDRALAWAVFPDVEDTSEQCAHIGRLFRLGSTALPVVLRCSSRPIAPAGTSYHILVILEDPVDLARLFEGELELAEARPLTLQDDHDPPDQTPTLWAVTSVRGGVLFQPWSPLQTLALLEPESPDSLIRAPR